MPWFRNTLVALVCMASICIAVLVSAEQPKPSPEDDQFSTTAGDRLSLIEAALKEVPPGLAKLRDFVSDSDSEVRLAAATGLYELGGPAEKDLALGVFAELLGDSQVKVRMQSGKFLRSQSVYRIHSIHKLEVALHKHQVGVEAVAVLFSSGTESAVEAITHAVTHPDPKVRRAAVGALGELGAKADQSVETLSRALSDPELSALVISTFGRIGGITGVDALMQVLRRDDTGQRILAARELGSLGAKAKRAIPLLVRATEHPNPDLVRAATEALIAIRGYAPEQDAN